MTQLNAAARLKANSEHPMINKLKTLLAKQATHLTFEEIEMDEDEADEVRVIIFHCHAFGIGGGYAASDKALDAFLAKEHIEITIEPHEGSTGIMCVFQ